MSIKLAIHLRQGSFSDRWIQYCSEYGIDYKLVNCFDSNLLAQLKGFSGLLWHWDLNEPAALLVARQIVASVEMMGIKVLCWFTVNRIFQV